MMLKVERRVTRGPGSVPDGLPAFPGSSSRQVREIIVNRGPRLQNFPFEKILSLEIRCDVTLLPSGSVCRVSPGVTWPWARCPVLTTRCPRRPFDGNPSRCLLVTAEPPCPASQIGGRANVVQVRLASPSVISCPRQERGSVFPTPLAEREAAPGPRHPGRPAFPGARLPSC